MKEEKNCMFQYVTKSDIIFNTDLITREEAESMWIQNKLDFIERHKSGEAPEMCIWINCRDVGDYTDSILHIDCDSVCKESRIYELTEVSI